MRTIGKIIPRTLESLEAASQEPKELKITSEVIDFVNHLFKIFEVHIKTFSVFASSAEKVEFTKKEWTRALSKHNLTKEQVIIGADFVRDKGLHYMLTPSEFIDLCLEKKPIKPQNDTRSLADYSHWESKDDKEKARLKESGKAKCADLLWKLRRGFSNEQGC
jgi:hypothetical protein